MFLGNGKKANLSEEMPVVMENIETQHGHQRKSGLNLSHWSCQAAAPLKSLGGVAKYQGMLMIAAHHMLSIALYSRLTVLS